MSDVSQYQKALAQRLGVTLPDPCTTAQAREAITPVLKAKVQGILQGNSALAVGKIIMYQGVPKKIVGIMSEKTKFVLQSPSGGKRINVDIIDLEDAEEAPPEN